MNKKMLVLLFGLVLFVFLVSCNLSNLFKKGETQEETPPQAQQEQQSEQPQSSETTEQPPQIVPPPQPPKKAEPKSGETKTTAESQSEEQKAEEATKEEEKVPMAGMGVIFVTNVRTGAFRVKIDDDKVIDHTFQGKSSGKADEIRYEKELKFPPGDHKFKFVCEDNQGSKGTKELSLSLQPREHKVVKVTVKGAPGDIKLEILE
jgi:type IV secretory pathway VirB10-like protein